MTIMDTTDSPAEAPEYEDYGMLVFRGIDQDVFGHLLDMEPDAGERARMLKGWRPGRGIAALRILESTDAEALGSAMEASRAAGLSPSLTAYVVPAGNPARAMALPDYLLDLVRRFDIAQVSFYPIEDEDSAGSGAQDEPETIVTFLRLGDAAFEDLVGIAPETDRDGMRQARSRQEHGSTKDRFYVDDAAGIERLRDFAERHGIQARDVRMHVYAPGKRIPLPDLAVMALKRLPILRVIAHDTDLPPLPTPEPEGRTPK